MDPHQKSFNPHKQLKEEFVSNLTGSSMVEIAALSVIVPALVLFRQWSAVKHSVDPCHAADTTQKSNNNVKNGGKDWRNYMSTLAVDFLYIVLPTLSIFTVLAEWTQVCAVCLIFIILLHISSKRLWSSTSHYFKGAGTTYLLRTYISSYRISMMIVTCLCILAVDFKIFPRRYAKTESYGTSLMDLGVGSFVLANSLVSRQARNTSSLNRKSVLLSVSPLIILGFARLAFTRGVDYQVHIGEYGVHWNFFFTLAAVSLLTSTIDIHPQYCGILGSLILIAYQTCLKYGLNEYLISNQRAMNIVSQNKEGLFSMFGYWGMYLFGVFLGNHLFFDNNSPTKMKSIQWARIRVWILCFLFWAMTIILDKNVESVSRRMCNLAFVSFVLAQNFQVLSILMLSDFLPAQRPLILEEAFDQNLLAAFLLANVLTGLVNLSVNTIFASSFAAFCILLGYSMVLSILVGFAKFSGIKLKFW